MPTTTTASSRRPPRRADRRAGLAALAPILLAAAAPAPPADPRPPVMMMTGLPLVWGEKGPFEPGSRPAAAYVDLREDFDLRPVDVLDRDALERGKVLFLAQPQRLAPAELAALDGWIRRGGRALILTDPMLTWPSGLPPGDIRRPPPVGLLSPLLSHWRLGLEAPVEAGEVAARWNGLRVGLDSPGRLRSGGPDCVVEAGGWTARCRIGRGRARIVADADLLRDSLWTRRGSENRAAVGEWLDSLHGRPRPRPRAGGPMPIWAGAIGFGLAALVAGLLLYRKRRR